MPFTVGLNKAAIISQCRGSGEEGEDKCTFCCGIEGGRWFPSHRRRSATTFLEKWHAVLTGYTDPPALNLDKGGAAISGVRSKSKRSGAISR